MSQFNKIIWQTHKWEHEDLPGLYKQTSKTWQVMNPDWEYRYIPNSKIRNEIEKINNANLLAFFDKKAQEKSGKEEYGMTIADIFREIMVYEYGGLWADMDSVCLFPIDKVIEKNLDKEMICLPPWTKFGMDQSKNYEGESFEESFNKLILGQECGYWISNAVFLGKKHNSISKEIIDSMSNGWKFKESSFMGIRYELYEKHYKTMSLDLFCAFHDGRFNLRNYS